ncbi:hypothetical protein ABFS82_08G098400 [Erythranthe guttata]|uniref:Myb-like domain-containing protein n=1 Tax=Erythranthe guttata TaxID=4155 RepID=A0A022RSJ5_ERYGU|nr:PREDICTED: trihelix transcription factor GT-2-like [Erythranthe guttata]EYU43477.1 hypothetical protein MIMGU_mgv1a004878mg [Erythranthe guttata]|eukprot:XP_012829956.1 PREDICTED: trihelix transcription factor GT-2-like [Erythranthe guttata]
MLESSVFLENSGGGASGGSASDAAAVEFGNEGGGGEEEGSRNSGGKRWPREETLALLKIRSEMDTAFRDSNLKAPLWDEVSRKLGELGYNRNAKKCKEKFENIYKYHKRTKDGRSIRHKGKNYKFFDQLELLDSQFSVPSTPLSQIPSYATEMTQIATTLLPKPVTNLFQDFTIQSELMSDSTSTSSSSGKDSQGSSKKKKKKKKRKLEDYLEGLVKDILEKQGEMQNKFLEAVEKSQNDRMARTEAWLSQEMATIKRERQILAQERSTASAKDAYVLDFLKKITHQDLPITHISEILDPLFNNKPCDNNEQENAIVNVNSIGEKNSSSVQTSSSRWPKAEVESLILLKTDLDMQYEENGPKGPLWEEISACMKKLGFERSAKRCKEKWENINKYYKRVKDGNKKRPQDSKTCPYFSMLESIYANKSKKARNNDNNNNTDVSGGGCNLKPEQILMQMMGQVQQQNQEQLIRGEYDDGDSDRQEQEDDDVSGCDGYQVVAANNNNMS